MFQRTFDGVDLELDAVGPRQLPNPHPSGAPLLRRFALANNLLTRSCNGRIVPDAVELRGGRPDPLRTSTRWAQLMAGFSIAALITYTQHLTTIHQSIERYNFLADRFRKHKKCVRDLGERPLGVWSKLENRGF